MHIAIVSVFPKDANKIDGGIAGVSKYLVEELVKQPDVKLTVIAPENDTGEITCEGWGDFNVYRMGKQGPWSLLTGTLYDIFAGKRRLRTLLGQINADIVHFQGTTFLAADCDQPHILTVHGIAEKDAIWDTRWGAARRLKWLLMRLTEGHGRRRVPNIILISEYTRSFLPTGDANRRTWFIDNPVADSYFDIKRRIKAGRIFCCGRVRPLKNTLGMIKAFGLIAQKSGDSHLIIAGSPEPAYLEKCKRQVAADGLTEKVHFLGNISIEDVQRELSKANCLVVPSFQENAPLTIAEAMAARVPVVAAKVGGIPEMVEDGGTGLLIDPHKPDSICDAVLKILSDRKLAHSMGRRAKKAAECRFRAAAVCEKTLQAYRDVLKQSS